MSCTVCSTSVVVVVGLREMCQCVVHMYYRLPYTVNLLNIKLLHVKNTLTYMYLDIDMLQESTGIWYVQKSSH